MRLTLKGKRGLAIQRSDVGRARLRTIAATGEQDAELFEALADGGNGLGQMQVALRGAAGGQCVRLCVGGVNAPAGEHVGAGREAGRHRAAGHQHFDALWAVAQQQHGGGGAHGSGRAGGVEELG